MINKKTLKTISEAQKLLILINNDINSQIDNLCKDITNTHEFDKQYLRTIRDENIKTITLINEMELKGMI